MPSGQEYGSAILAASCFGEYDVGQREVARAMRLRRIRLQNTLSFVDSSITCDHHVTAIVGPNDAGKSNILRVLHHLTGPKPTLKFPREMEWQFADGKHPAVDLSLVFDPGDEDVLKSAFPQLGITTATTAAVATCRDDSLLFRAGEIIHELHGEEAEGFLGTLLNSVFVQPQLRPLGSHIALGDLAKDIPSQEARLFYLIGLTKTDLADITRRNNRGTRRLVEASERLTSMLQAVWKQDSSIQISLSHRSLGIGESVLDIVVSDSSETHVLLDRRGEGLRWFLAMLIQINEKPHREQALCRLFLIDEPGVFLHPAGQADLHALLNQLTDSPGSQVIYTTHSPFMLDWARPHQVRIVERDRSSPFVPSTIVDKPYHSNETLNFWEPYRRSIGLFLGDMGLLGEKNLLVEGATDQILIAHLVRSARQLSDWRIIPFGNSHALALIAKTCKQAGRTVVVLVDGDDGGKEYLDALKRFDCSDIPIHSLLEFCSTPMDDMAFSIEDFLSTKEYLDAVNEAYAELPWYTPVTEADVEETNVAPPIAKRLEQVFANREWADQRKHGFSKAHVSMHIASARRPIQLQNLAGKLYALVQRLEGSVGPVLLGVSESLGNEPEWSAIFNLMLRREIGVQETSIRVEGSDTDCEWIFPTRAFVAVPATNESSSDHADGELHEQQAESSAADTLPQDTDNDTAQAKARGSISVFDCWLRRWIDPRGAPFLKNGSATIQITQLGVVPDPDLVLAVTTEYVDGLIETQKMPLVYERKADKTSVHFTKEIALGKMIKGVVKEISEYPPMGFDIKVDGYNVIGFVHVGQINGGWVDNVSDHVSVGDRIEAKYLGVDYGRHQFSLL